MKMYQQRNSWLRVLQKEVFKNAYKNLKKKKQYYIVKILCLEPNGHKNVVQKTVFFVRLFNKRRSFLIELGCFLLIQIVKEKNSPLVE